MLDFLGTILTATLMVVVVNALVTYLEIGRSAKLTLAGIAGLWIGLAGAASASGWFTIAKPFPVIGIFVLTPLVAAAITDPDVQISRIRFFTREVRSRRHIRGGS